MTTQKVDKEDAALGFTHGWIEELAKHWDQITVICLYEGKHTLPQNVTVRSLGKEKGSSRIQYILLFFWYMATTRYNRVFVHMNPEYVVLGGWWWRLSGKKIALWYSHKSTDLKLCVAVWFVHTVFTTAPLSVTFASKKLQYMGHGISVQGFHCSARLANELPIIVSVGRITPIKQCEVLISALQHLHKLGLKAVAVLIGPTSAKDVVYEERLCAQVRALALENSVIFTGPIPLDVLQSWYCKADFVVNMTPTGGLDKAVLEGMAAGAITLSSNAAFHEYFESYAARLEFVSGDSSDLAQKVVSLWHAKDREEVKKFLTKKAEFFDLPVFIHRLSVALKKM